MSGSATIIGRLPCAPARAHDAGIQVVIDPTSSSSSSCVSRYASSPVVMASLSYGPRITSLSAATSDSVQSVAGAAAGASGATVASGGGAPSGGFDGSGGVPRSPTCHSAAVLIGTSGPVSTLGRSGPALLGRAAAGAGWPADPPGGAGPPGHPGEVGEGAVA